MVIMIDGMVWELYDRRDGQCKEGPGRESDGMLKSNLKTEGREKSGWKIVIYRNGLGRYNRKFKP
jgi:hypothetical protein